MLITLMTVVAISCGDDVEDPVIYTVTVMTAEGGTVDASCDEVIAGEEVTLVATPESGYRFKCWMLNGVEVSTQNPYTTVVNKNTVYVDLIGAVPRHLHNRILIGAQLGRKEHGQVLFKASVLDEHGLSRNEACFIE